MLGPFRPTKHPQISLDLAVPTQTPWLLSAWFVVMHDPNGLCLVQLIRIILLWIHAVHFKCSWICMDPSSPPIYYQDFFSSSSHLKNYEHICDYFMSKIYVCSQIYVPVGPDWPIFWQSERNSPFQMYLDMLGLFHHPKHPNHPESSPANNAEKLQLSDIMESSMNPMDCDW